MANILVYIELVNDSASWASLLALRQARSLSTQVGATIYAVLPCAKPPLYGENDIIAILSRQGADKVILMTHRELSPPTIFATHGEALLAAANQFPPALLLVPDGPAAAELAPRVAARLGGLFVRHPDLSVQPGCSLRIDQPLFDDTHVRRIETADLEHSVVAVVAPDPQQYSRPQGTEEAEVVVISPGFADDGSAAPPVPAPADAESDVDIGRPQRIVLVGAGVTEAAEVEAIRQLAEVLKAQLRVTEDAAALGLLEAPTLDEAPLICRPELVLAFGVRGSPATLGLLAKTTYLVGVNTDAKAPLFARAQLGLVAPALEAAGQMVKEARSRSAQPLLPVPEEEPAEEPAEEPDEPAPDEAADGVDSSLRDTIPPDAGADESRAAAPTEEMDAALKDTVKASGAAREPTGKQAPTTPPAETAGAAEPGAPAINPALAATIRPVDFLAHTPPMGTPLSAELKAALEAGHAAADAPGHGAIPTDTATPPTPAEPVADKTPEAIPAGVVQPANDPALDDTVPAPLPQGTPLPDDEAPLPQGTPPPDNQAPLLPGTPPPNDEAPLPSGSAADEDGSEGPPR